MLVLLIRILFVVLAVLVGWANSSFFTLGLADDLPPWSGGVVGFSIAITLIAAEQAFRRRFTRSIVAVLIGVSGGLALSMLTIGAMSLVIQDDALRNRLDLPIALVITYLVVVLVVQNVDRLRLIVPFAEFRPERIDGVSVVIEPEALADGRLRGLVEGGLLVGAVAIHRSALALWERRAADADPAVAVRGRRALALVADLRGLGVPRVEIDDTELPGHSDPTDAALRLARLSNARVVTADPSAADRCRAEGLRPLHLPALAVALSPVVRPGDTLDLAIVRVGDGRNQGVGFLDDGSMVIVNGAAEAVGREIRCVVQRLHPTANGRMVFADKVA